MNNYEQSGYNLIPKDYDSTSPPWVWAQETNQTDETNSPTTVEIFAFVSAIPKIEEHSQTISVELILERKWIDPRLGNQNRSIEGRKSKTFFDIFLSFRTYRVKLEFISQSLYTGFGGN